MAQKPATAKTSTINRAPLALSALLEHYCRGLDRWPRAWTGMEKDLPLGEKLVACFRPFMEHLIVSDLSPKTIQKHVDNLWLLGGEIIRDLNEDPSLRKLPVERLLHDTVDVDGGPPIHNGSEEEQRSFDSTCRRLHRFLTHTQPAPRCAGKRGGIAPLAQTVRNRDHDHPFTHRFPGRGLFLDKLDDLIVLS